MDNPEVDEVTDEKLEALEALEVEGKLNGETVVSLAADPDHALHSSFTWDDEKAAHYYRVSQANRLIARYRIVVDDQGRKARRFSFVASEGRHMESRDAVRDHRDELEVVARREARRFVERYRRLGHEFLRDAVDDALS